MVMQHEHMKRTTIYLDPDLELALKSEVLRGKKPMAALIRDALRAYLGRAPGSQPPGAGAFRSGHRDTAGRADAILAKTRFAARTSYRTRRPRRSRSTLMP